MSNQITVTFNQEQAKVFEAVWAEAKAKAKAIADWTGETPEQIEARFAVVVEAPAPEFDEDQADWLASTHSGVPMF